MKNKFLIIGLCAFVFLSAVNSLALSGKPMKTFDTTDEKAMIVEVIRLLEGAQAKEAVEQAIRKLEKSLADIYWETDSTLTIFGESVFQREINAVNRLMKIDPPSPPVSVAMYSLIKAAENLADTSLDQAWAKTSEDGCYDENGGTNYCKQILRKISDAEYAMDLARKIQVDEPDDAILNFKKAWRFAQLAMGKIPQPDDDDDDDDVCTDNIRSILISHIVGGALVDSPVKVSSQVHFTASAVFCDDSTELVTGKVLWVSDNPEIAYFEGDNILRAKKIGTVNLYAELDGVVSNTIIVEFIMPETVSLFGIKIVGSDIVDIDGTTKLQAIADYSDLSKSDISDIVAWSSSNDAIASVDETGMVKAHSEGSVTISVEHNEATMSAIVIAVVPFTDKKRYISKLISPKGGKIFLGDIKLDFPLGCFDRDTIVSIAEIDPSGTPPSVFNKFGKYYIVDVEGEKINGKVKVAMEYNPKNLSPDTDEDSLMLQKFNGSDWIIYPSDIDTRRSIVTTEAKEFSPFGIIETVLTPSPPPSHTIENVPYYNQWGTSWCIVTTTSMLFKYYGITKKILDIISEPELQYDPDDVMTYGDQIRILRKYFGAFDVEGTSWLGIEAKRGNYRFFTKFIKLKLSKDRPMIVNAHGHSVLLKGYDEKYIYVHDPSGAMYDATEYASGDLVPDDCMGICKAVEWDIAVKWMFPSFYSIASLVSIHRTGLSQSSATVDLNISNGVRFEWNNGGKSNTSPLIPDGRHEEGYYWRDISGKKNLSPDTSLMGLENKINVPFSSFFAYSYYNAENLDKTFVIREPDDGNIIYQSNLNLEGKVILPENILCEDNGKYFNKKSGAYTIDFLLNGGDLDRARLFFEPADPCTTEVQGSLQCFADDGSIYPVRGAQISATSVRGLPVTNNICVQDLAIATSDENGSYKLGGSGQEIYMLECGPDTPDSSWHLNMKISWDGIIDNWESKAIVLNGVTSGSQESSGEHFVVAPLTSVVGRIIDGSGSPLSGATVAIDGKNALEVSSADGSFKFDGVSLCGLDTVTLRAEYGGIIGRSIEIEAVSPETNVGTIIIAQSNTFVLKLIRDDGQIINTNNLDFFIIRDQSKGYVNFKQSYNPVTEQWTLVITSDVNPGDEYWVAYSVKAPGISTQYPYRYKFTDMMKSADLIAPGTYEDRVPYFKVTKPWTEMINGEDSRSIRGDNNTERIDGCPDISPPDCIEKGRCLDCIVGGRNICTNEEYAEICPKYWNDDFRPCIKGGWYYNSEVFFDQDDTMGWEMKVISSIPYTFGVSSRGNGSPAGRWSYSEYAGMHEDFGCKEEVCENQTQAGTLIEVVSDGLPGNSYPDGLIPKYGAYTWIGGDMTEKTHYFEYRHEAPETINKFCGENSFEYRFLSWYIPLRNSSVHNDAYDNYMKGVVYWNWTD